MPEIYEVKLFYDIQTDKMLVQTVYKTTEEHLSAKEWEQRREELIEGDINCVDMNGNRIDL